MIWSDMGLNGTMPQRRAIWGGSIALWRGLMPRKRGEKGTKTPLLLLLAFASLADCSPPANDFHVSESALSRLTAITLPAF